MSIKPVRFVWRVLRNLVCAAPGGASLLFPSTRLANAFGRGDAEYAWAVFQHHDAQLRQANARNPRRVLEVGPGRNLGTALLFWASRRGASETLAIVCWDVFKNASPETPGFWEATAQALIEAADKSSPAMSAILPTLHEVARGVTRPAIVYQVQPIAALVAGNSAEAARFDLVYSHAAIEHVWSIESFWTSLAGVTASQGWHSHRIDLADHGRRETNYIEMLEWSPLAYWITMRFVPGATNRWRASRHLAKIKALGFQIVYENRVMEPSLPIAKNRLSAEFRALADDELKTIALDVVARLQ